MEDEDHLTVRSYRRVWQIEHRLYHIPLGDGRRMTLSANGIRLWTLGYALITWATLLVLSWVPVVDLAVGQMPVPLRWFIIPAVVAVVLMDATPDGRKPHRFIASWIALHLRRRRRSAGRPVPLEGERGWTGGTLPTQWDADSPQLRRGKVSGPAEVAFAKPVDLRGSWRGQTIAQPRRGGCNHSNSVPEGHVLEIRP